MFPERSAFQGALRVWRSSTNAVSERISLASHSQPAQALDFAVPFALETKSAGTAAAIDGGALHWRAGRRRLRTAMLARKVLLVSARESLRLLVDRGTHAGGGHEIAYRVLSEGITDALRVGALVVASAKRRAVSHVAERASGAANEQKPGGSSRRAT
jgi:hypothetical protein